MGYLAYNDYLRREPLVFLSDGAAGIHDEIKGLYHLAGCHVLQERGHSAGETESKNTRVTAACGQFPSMDPLE
jgi:hypothetical protein